MADKNLVERNTNSGPSSSGTLTIWQNSPFCYDNILFSSHIFYYFVSHHLIFIFQRYLLQKNFKYSISKIRTNELRYECDSEVPLTKNHFEILEKLFFSLQKLSYFIKWVPADHYVDYTKPYSVLLLTIFSAFKTCVLPITSIQRTPAWHHKADIFSGPMVSVSKRFYSIMKDFQKYFKYFLMVYPRNCSVIHFHGIKRIKCCTAAIMRSQKQFCYERVKKGFGTGLEFLLIVPLFFLHILRFFILRTRKFQRWKSRMVFC